MSVPDLHIQGGSPRADLTATDVERHEIALPIWAAADLTNVIPFVRRQRPDSDAESSPRVELVADERPAPASPDRDRRAWIACLILASCAAHAGLFWFLKTEPPPLASIGVETMSVEIVLGNDMPSGVPEEAAKPAQEPEKAASEPVQEAAQPPQTAEPEPQRQAAQPPQPEPPPVPSETAPAIATVEPPPAPSTPPPVLSSPRGRDTVSAPPVEHRKRAEPALAPKPKQPPHERHAMLPAGSRPPAPSAGGLGPGRSDADTNYRGAVVAHLARYKQFPAEARSRGDRGVATVAFTLDGAGRVTAVRLARGSGFASLDQEVQAMVHRASPFPAPPGGRPMSFAVPVSFRLQ